MKEMLFERERAVMKQEEQQETGSSGRAGFHKAVWLARPLSRQRVVCSTFRDGKTTSLIGRLRSSRRNCFCTGTLFVFTIQRSTRMTGDTIVQLHYVFKAMDNYIQYVHALK